MTAIVEGSIEDDEQRKKAFLRIRAARIKEQNSFRGRLEKVVSFKMPTIARLENRLLNFLLKRQDKRRKKKFEQCFLKHEGELRNDGIERSDKERFDAAVEMARWEALLEKF